MTNPKHKPDWLKSLFVFLLLTTLGLIIYSNTFQADFQFDDLAVIEENLAIRQLTNINGMWEVFRTRFIAGITFALNYHFGGLNVWGYHLLSLFIHVCASYLVYVFVKLLFTTPALNNHSSTKHSFALGCVAAAIFLVHPIQTESVTYITQRSSSLATVFYLAALIFYIKSRLTSIPSFRYYALVMTVCAMFTKEFSFTIPFSLICCEVFFLDDIQQDFRTKFQKIKIFLWTFMIIPIVLSLKGNSLLGLGRQIRGSSFDMRNLLTEINVLRTYGRLLFFPINQNLDYDYPIAQGLFEFSTILSVAFLLGLSIFSFFLYRKHRLGSFCVFWFFIATSVEAGASSLIGRDMIFEHYLYLPMVGFAIGISLCLFSLITSPRILRKVFIILIAALSILTYHRNIVWQTKLSLWEDTLKKSPHKARPRLNRGLAYYHLGHSDLALLDYNAALQIDPQYREAYIDRGSIYLDLGFYDMAIDDFNKALELQPDSPMTLNNLGTVYMKSGQIDVALAYFNRALEILPDFALSRYNRSVVYREKGLHSIAMNEALQARQLGFPVSDRYLSGLRMALEKGEGESVFLK